MRSACWYRVLIFVALFCSIPAYAQINPRTQIRWPGACGTGPGMTYNWQTNSCINMNAIDPSTQVTWPSNCNQPGMVYNQVTNTCLNMNAIDPNSQVTWPSNCNQPGMVYNKVTNSCINMNAIDPGSQVTWPASCNSGSRVFAPSINTCINNGSAANPGGTSGQLQWNHGGVFDGSLLTTDGASLTAGAKTTISPTNAPNMMTLQDPTPGYPTTGPGTAQSNITGALQPQNYFNLNSLGTAEGRMFSAILNANGTAQYRVMFGGDSTAEFHSQYVTCDLTKRLGWSGFDMGAPGTCMLGASGVTTNSTTGTVISNNGTTVPYDFTRSPTGVVFCVQAGGSVTFGAAGGFAFGNILKVYYLIEPSVASSCGGGAPGTMTITANTQAGSCPTGCTLFSGSVANATTAGQVLYVNRGSPDYYTLTISASGGSVDVFAVGIYDETHSGIINVAIGRGGLSLPDWTSTPDAVTAQWYASAFGQPIAITNCSVTSNVATFTTAPQGLAAGNIVLIGGITSGACAPLQDITGTVLASGLTSTQFSINFTTANIASTATTGQVFGPSSFGGLYWEMKDNGVHGGTSGCQLATTANPSNLQDFSYWLNLMMTKLNTANPWADTVLFGSYPANPEDSCLRTQNETERQWALAHKQNYYDAYFQASPSEMTDRGWIPYAGIHSNQIEQFANAQRIDQQLAFNNGYGGFNGSDTRNNHTATNNFWISGPSNVPNAVGPSGYGVCPTPVPYANGNQCVPYYNSHLWGYINRTNWDLGGQFAFWDYNHTNPIFCVAGAAGNCSDSTASTTLVTRQLANLQSWSISGSGGGVMTGTCASIGTCDLSFNSTVGNGAGRLIFSNNSVLEWQAGTNLSGIGGFATFGVHDTVNNRNPFTIAQGAPDQALRVTGIGISVGGGTSLSAFLTGQATPAFGTIAAQTCAEQTINVTNATTSARAVMVTPTAAPSGGTNITWSGYVSAAGVVTVRLCNVATASATPTATWNVLVIQ